MDYLPIKAISVPYEHMFLLAKKTDTAKGNWINPMLIEVLQLLKFSLKKECLNFIAGWSMPENTMGRVCKPNPSLLGSLFAEDPDTGMDNILNEFSIHNHNS